MSEHSQDVRDVDVYVNVAPKILRMSSAYSAIHFTFNHEVLERDILPRLEHLAQNPNLVHQHLERRFNREEPPSWYAFTPPSCKTKYLPGGEPVLWPSWARDIIMAELEDLTAEPLNEEELKILYDGVVYDRPSIPYSQYQSDESAVRFSAKHHSDWYEKKGGKDRFHVFARHKIKKYWQSLGVWNPQWGIPGHRGSESPRHKLLTWRWPWRMDSSDEDEVDRQGLFERRRSDKELGRRLVDLRRGLRRGELEELPSQGDYLPAGASKEEGDAFLISRPWLVHSVDKLEESIRLDRVPRNKEFYYNMNQVYHYCEKFKLRSTVPWAANVGWIWNSASPFYTFDCDFPDEEELTPSEIDALEAIPPPSPPTPPPPPQPRIKMSFTPGLTLFGYRIPDTAKKDPMPSDSTIVASKDTKEKRARSPEQSEQEVIDPSSSKVSGSSPGCPSTAPDNHVAKTSGEEPQDGAGGMANSPSALNDATSPGCTGATVAETIRKDEDQREPRRKRKASPTEDDTIAPDPKRRRTHSISCATPTEPVQRASR